MNMRVPKCYLYAAAVLAAAVTQASAQTRTETLSLSQSLSQTVSDTSSATMTLPSPTDTFSATLPTPTETESRSDTGSQTLRTRTLSVSATLRTTTVSDTVTETNSLTLRTATVTRSTTLRTGTESYSQSLSSTQTLPSLSGTVSETQSGTDSATLRTATPTVSLPACTATPTQELCTEMKGCVWNVDLKRCGVDCVDLGTDRDLCAGVAGCEFVAKTAANAGCIPSCRTMMESDACFVFKGCEFRDNICQASCESNRVEGLCDANSDRCEWRDLVVPERCNRQCSRLDASGCRPHYDCSWNAADNACVFAAPDTEDDSCWKWSRFHKSPCLWILLGLLLLLLLCSSMLFFLQSRRRSEEDEQNRLFDHEKPLLKDEPATYPEKEAAPADEAPLQQPEEDQATTVLPEPTVARKDAHLQLSPEPPATQSELGHQESLEATQTVSPPARGAGRGRVIDELFDKLPDEGYQPPTESPKRPLVPSEPRNEGYSNVPRRDQQEAAGMLGTYYPPAQPHGYAVASPSHPPSFHPSATVMHGALTPGGLGTYLPPPQHPPAPPGSGGGGVYPHVSPHVGGRGHTAHSFQPHVTVPTPQQQQAAAADDIPAHLFMVI